MNRSFFEQDTVTVAREILGWLLISRVGGKEVIVEITETEAYKGDDDPASHAYGRVTPRNSIMFGQPGILYVYLSYGMHDCMNIVTEKEGIPGAVLIRAARPISGVHIIQERRPRVNERDLMNGPGKLTKALGITRAHNGYDLISSAGEIELVPHYEASRTIIVTPRIGITKAKDYPWRFVMN